MSRAKTNAERQAAYRARRAAERTKHGLTRRELYLTDDEWRQVKELARKLAEARVA